MASAPQDLKDLRAGIMLACGFRDPNEVGIAPDRDHTENGGYHCGEDDLLRIAKFHWARTQHVGATTEDYSARLLRDRLGLTNDSSALDHGDNWPNGGRAAWLRFNRMLLAQLQAGDPALMSIRAINFSPDGAKRKRWDREHPHAGPAGDGVIDSTDTVTIHTHTEWYRDTLGARHPSVQRYMEIVVAAINNTKLEDDMADFTPQEVNAWTQAGRVEAVIGDLPVIANGADAGKPNRLHSRLVAIETAVGQQAAAVAALQTGGVDVNALADLLADKLGDRLVTLEDVERVVQEQGKALLNSTHLSV